MQKKCVLIFIRIIRCFLNMCRFWTLFQFPAGSPSRVNFSCSKLLCFIALLKLSRWKLLENDSFKWIAPTLWPKKCSKWSQTIYRSLRFKDTFSKCFKTEAPRLWRKIGDQMRELACFALFSHGSSQLGQLIDLTLRRELHRKVTIKPNGNHRKARKQCFNLWVLVWALCLV